MKFKIFNKAGRELCLQYASSADEAVQFARMYGYKAWKAELCASDS